MKPQVQLVTLDCIKPQKLVTNQGELNLSVLKHSVGGRSGL